MKKPEKMTYADYEKQVLADIKCAEAVMDDMNYAFYTIAAIDHLNEVKEQLKNKNNKNNKNS